ncbi:MAG: DNA polymerase III subunit epsilon [Alphaproteobacteria bacterium]|nr:DNA polymerase III subunit epsilon [Alphaproteobacteria bacterium]
MTEPTLSAARAIVLDVETTGLDPRDNHYIVEVAALELINMVPSSSYFHHYINPLRDDVPQEVIKIHGLTKNFLADKPVFADLVDDFLAFIGDSPLIIHNAEFDMKFINAELERCHRPSLPMSRAICTLVMAKKKFPGAGNSLDKLCERFSIDRSQRSLHGAKIDVELLAKVYLALMGGRQIGMSLDKKVSATLGNKTDIVRVLRPPRPHQASPEELQRHQASLAKLKSPLWTE